MVWGAVPVISLSLLWREKKKKLKGRGGGGVFKPQEGPRSGGSDQLT